MKKIIKEVYPYVIIVVSIILIRVFLVTPVIVSGGSMNPTLENGELLILRKVGYGESKIERFDIVTIKNDGEEIIKRIIGLPGEHISYRNDTLYVNDEKVGEPFLARKTVDFNLEEICNCTEIPKGKYLVLGDNRPISKDSRAIGLIDEEDIVGKAEFRLWPLTKIGSIYKKK